MMSSLKLASAGDDVKLWDFQTLDLFKQYNPHDQNVSALSWSEDATWLASASVLDNKIALSCVKNASLPIVSLDCEEGQTCVVYSSNSRHLLSGGTSGAVRIWDIKSKKVKKCFKDHKSTVTSVCFDRNDNCIASGSESGEIIISNVVSGLSSSALTAPKTQAVRQIQFKKSLLGAVYDSGSVCFWDTNTRRLIHMFTNVHRAPATGIVFSPLNEMLMMTVGLDKRLILYDVISKVTLNVIETDSPLTAIDLMQDGSTVAVGSTRGKVTVYDLRLGSTPITSFTAHKSSVQSLRFQPGSKFNQPETSGDKVNKANRRQLPSAPKDVSEKEPAKIINDSTASNSNQTEEQLTTSASVEEIFSPVREGDSQNQSSNLEIHNSVGNQSSIHNHSKSLGYNTSLQNISQGIFSPLGRNSSLLQHQLEHASSHLTHNSNSSNVNHSQTNIQVNHDSHHQVFNGSVSLQPEHPYESSLASSAIGSTYEEYSKEYSPKGVTASPSLPALQSVYEHSNQGEGAEGETVDENRYDQHSSDKAQQQTSIRVTPRQFKSSRSGWTANSPVMDGGSEESTMLHMREMAKGVIKTYKENRQEKLKAMWRKTNDPNSSSSKRDGSSSHLESSVFQTEFLRSIIHEEMEEFRAESHRDLQALHIEILKQFQIQQAEISTLIQHYSVNRELVAEIERLREENARLKKYF